MKHIIKQREPQVFTDWKSMDSEDWQPTYKNLSGEPKEAVKNALMDEQGYICCYCERRLTDEDSHIEHFRPQSDPAADALDYGNMLCSCMNNLQKGEPRRCGNLKENWFDERLLISPLDPSCEESFAYTGDGHVKPADSGDEAAAMTIKKLGLDIPKLNALRARAIEPFLEDGLSIEDLKRFVTGYLQRGINGMYSEFWTMIRYLFRGYESV